VLKRVYIDNYRCCVNFELVLKNQQLILGLNGSGKSTLLDALRSIRDVCTRDTSPGNAFPKESRTRWQTRQQQTFELDVELNDSYKFVLQLEHVDRPARTRIVREAVFCNRQTLFDFHDGEVHLHSDRYEMEIAYPFDPFRSALATIQSSERNSLLMRFKDWLSDLHCLQLNPYRMLSSTSSEDPRPSNDLANFASWYRHLAQEHPDSSSSLRATLKKVLPGFESLNLPSSGGPQRLLKLKFGTGDRKDSAPYEIGFDELSEGQRILVCLYTILEFLIRDSGCVFLDEPENFIALPEIQPWLMELQDRLEEKGGQTSLISHHPEMINYLAADCGIVFERDGSGPVRVKPFSTSNSPLQPSEQIARGWV